MKDFRSDNVLPAAPEILDAVARANTGATTSYGGDDITARVRRRCCEIFETDVEVFPILSGIAGNALAIAALTPQWGAVFCHAHAHIEREELGAATFFSGGAKLVPIDGADGKLHADDVAAAVARTRKSDIAVPACLSITNATEAGTVYSAEALGDVARAANLRVHLDGARFANAIVATGASPAALSWRAGVDALTFGATKNGAMTADMIEHFRKELAPELAIRIHRAGHRPSKMRFLSAQLEAYLADDLWLRHARHANAMAARLADGVRAHVEIVRPVEANIVFVRFPPPLAAALQGDGFQFFDWPIFGEDVYRLVCGYATTEADVDGLVAALRG